MEKDAQLVLRLPAEMHDRLRAYAAQQADKAGVPVSVAAAARKLLSEGLGRAGLDRADRMSAGSSPAPKAAKKRTGAPK